jgi:hypothetical protein
MQARLVETIDRQRNEELADGEENTTGRPLRNSASPRFTSTRSGEPNTPLPACPFPFFDLLMLREDSI